MIEYRGDGWRDGAGRASSGGVMAEFVETFRRLGSFGWEKFGSCFESLQAPIDPVALRASLSDETLEEVVLLHRDAWFVIRIRLADFLFYWERMEATGHPGLGQPGFARELHCVWTPKMRLLYRTLESAEWQGPPGPGVWEAAPARGGGAVKMRGPTGNQTAPRGVTPNRQN